MTVGSMIAMPSLASVAVGILYATCVVSPCVSGAPLLDATAKNIVQQSKTHGATGSYRFGDATEPRQRWPDVSATNRSVLFWLEPYVNLTSEADYEQAWAQFGARAKAGYIVAGSAYAAKVNGSLGYATTSAGEGKEGILMEQYGFPVLKKFGLTTIAMVYVTHFAAINKIVADPEPFIESLVAKAKDVGLDGFDIDYEPQEGETQTLDPHDYMAFLDKLATAMQANKLLLTMDIGSCPQFNAFQCSARPSGLAQVNTMSTFGSTNVDTFKALAGSNNAADLGHAWAPGFEPANCGAENFGPILKAAASLGARRLAMWEVHECNVGPQPAWLFDAVDAFLAMN